MSTNTFITKKNLRLKREAKRSQVWAKFLELRGAGKRPILMDAEGWTYVCVPDEVQPELDDELRFLDEFYRLETLPGEGFTDSGRLSLDGQDALLGEAPFIGGWVGFMTYNQGAKWMGVKSRHETAFVRCGLPKMFWRFCSEIYAFQVGEEDLRPGVNLNLGPAQDFQVGEESLLNGRSGNGLSKVSRKSPGIFGLNRDELPSFKVAKLKSNITREGYERGIGEVKKLLRDGETYQVNFAQEFSGDFEGDAFGLYARMFQMNPARMGFFAEGEVGADGHGDWAVCSNSPERLVSLRIQPDGRRLMRTEPIKGTVAHDEDPQFLLRDEKSYAELTMIVDLMRNDLGRVAKVGSVKVPRHQSLMELANVWHTYSVIEAELAEDKTVVDMIRAVFPGGSIVGCPKKRTMEIIDRLVDFSWGAYCGSAGYVSLNGNADFNIMIRTAQVFGGGSCGGCGGKGANEVVGKRRVSFGAGGGIVMDSDAAAEYQETLDKAATFKKAVDAV